MLNFRILAMKNKDIHLLAEKFWNGETSVSEDEQLRDQLRWGDVPTGLESLSDYLSYTEQTKSKALTDEFDQEVLRKINKPKTRIFSMPNLAKIAAAVLVLFFATIVFNNLDTQTKIAEQSEFIDTYQDSEEAYREVRSALMMVSSSMNNGMAHTQMLGKFDEAKKKTENRK